MSIYSSLVSLGQLYKPPLVRFMPGFDVYEHYIVGSTLMED